jgi:wyosine [tRNA(Phe)-imidazoG37] synthetase (radical SAM superfamily)
VQVAGEKKKIMKKVMAKKYSHLFGPVPSRRFGQSLGVDLTPYKTCSLDCIFCQLGRTLNKTVTRREYVSTDAVISELRHWLNTNGKADYITLSGSGEPTLHSQFGKVIEFINNNSSIPTALLTNGTLLNLPEVRKSACEAKVVKISLSAWDQASYEQVNRPYPNLQFDQLVEGQKAFRARYKGQLWMEVFLISGINSRPDQLRNISLLAKKITPDHIHLNTAVRPPSEDVGMALSEQEMSALAPLFHPRAEVMAEFNADLSKHVLANQATILAMLQRRPCTAKQIAAGFDMHFNTVTKYLGQLMRTHRIRSENRNADVYYVAIDTE